MTAAAIAAREAARAGRQEQLELLQRYERGETVTYKVPNNDKGYTVAKKDISAKPSSGKRIRFTQVDQLLDSASYGDLKAIEKLLDDGLDVNSCDADGITALHRVAVENHLNVARTLVERGANVNAVDVDFWTPLHSAASSGHWRLANFLIQSGAQVTAVNADGDLPLDLSAESKVENVLKRELESLGLDTPEKLEELRAAVPNKMLADVKAKAASGGDLNEKDSSGATLLHVACCNGFKDVVTFLLSQKSVNLNAPDDEGNTPLHLASFFGQYEIALQLVTKGADLQAKNFLQQKPIVMSEDQVMVRLLSTLEQKQRLSDGDIALPTPVQGAGRTKSSTLTKAPRGSIRDTVLAMEKAEAFGTTAVPLGKDEVLDPEEEERQRGADEAAFLAAAKQRQMDVAQGKVKDDKQEKWEPFVETWFNTSDEWDHQDAQKIDKATGVKIWGILRYFEKGVQVGEDYPVSELEVLVSNLKERRTETNFVLDHLECGKDSALAKARKEFGDGLKFRADDMTGNVSVQLMSSSKHIVDMDLHKALSTKATSPVRIFDTRDLAKHIKSCLRAGPTDEALSYAIAPMKKTFYFGKEKEKAIRKGKPPTAHVQLEYCAAIVEARRAFAEAEKAKVGQAGVTKKH